jgi:type I restriction enzyme S subunit
MEGMACTEDVLRVIPDPEKVLPGYLYAYLSSKFGVPQVISGTYGAIIQHIEPQHIAGLPVPRLGEKLERRVHELVEEAAESRGEAAVHRERAIAGITEVLAWSPSALHSLWTPVSSSKLRRRMDGFHHTRPVEAARVALASHPTSARLGDVVDEVFEPNRGARLKVEDPAFGVPFLSSSVVFRLDPMADYLVSRGRTPHLDRLLVHDVDVLIPRSGQLGGIIGHSVLPLPSYYGDAASEHLVRVRCRSAEDAKYIWAVFASQPGYFAAIGTAFGSSIPSLDCGLLQELRVPWLEGPARTKIVQDAAGNVELLAAAIKAEREAVEIVERAIEEAT